MKQISGETVRKQAAEWFSYYKSNNTRGREAVKFYLGEQWTNSRVSKRSNSNKETMVFNLCAKQVRRAHAQLRETEFSLNIAPANEEAQENVQETAAFRKVLQNIMLSNNEAAKFASTGDKCLKYGYSFLEVNYGYENDKTRNLIPILRLHKDPSIAFWDKNATHPSRIDGRFCGIEKRATKEEIVSKLKNLPASVIQNLVNEEDNKVIYYWFRDYRPAKFKLLKCGEYKREEEISFDDGDELETEEGARLIFEELCESDKLAQGYEPSPLEKEDEISCIYFQIFINEKKATDPKLFPTDDLPVPYHHGFTEWDGKDGMRTTPLVEFLKDPQRLHNYVHSQIATMAKNSSSDKWFFNNDHILTPTQLEEAREINTLEGGFNFGGDANTIRREKPAELPVSLIQMGQLTKQEMDEIGGAMIDAQQSDATVVSGKAIKEITHNMGLLNLSFMAAHIEFVNTVGHLVRQMIPRLITEERTIVAKNKDGSGEAIVVNRDLGTGDIQNNIKDINNNFIYDITPGPLPGMQKENTVKYISDFISINPQSAGIIGDILMRNLDTPDAGELERRVAAMMDPNLIKYGRGEISLQEYQQANQQNQQQQQQQQMQQAQMMSKLDPQVQAATIVSQSQDRKAQMDNQVKQMGIEEAEKTKRMKIAADNQINIAKAQAQILELMQRGKIEEANQQLELLEKHLKANQQLIDIKEMEREPKAAD